MLKVLSSKKLMQIPYKDFDIIWTECSELFKLWSNYQLKFRDQAEHTLGKRGQKLEVFNVRVVESLAVSDCIHPADCSAQRVEGSSDGGFRVP